MQYDELEDSLRDSGVLAQTEKTEHLEVNTEKDINKTLKYINYVFPFDGVVKVKTFLFYLHISLLHMYFLKIFFVLLQIKARQMEHAKRELERDIGQLKGQLEQQREHRIEQERRVGTSAVITAMLWKTS